MQHEIYHHELEEAHEALISFSDGFEEMYYQRRSDRIHFNRPSMHTPSHFPDAAKSVGPPVIYSQYMIEHIIGLLGAEVRQPSNPFANLAQQALIQCQTSALHVLLPNLGFTPQKKLLPKRALCLGDGYGLLRRRERYPHDIRDCERDAVQAYLSSPDVNFLKDKWYHVRRWAGLQIPNGHKARSRWSEPESTTDLRRSRCVKVWSVV
jgi:hypothetical protein